MVPPLYRSLPGRCLVLAAILCLTAATAATASDHAATDYSRLLEARYSSPEVLPEAGVVIRHDEAEWRLTSGTFSALEATTDGTVTGYYFQGQGQFSIPIADVVEQGQIARMAEREPSERFAVAFEELLLRGSDLAALNLPATSGSLGPGLKVAQDRQNEQLVHEFADLDARIVGGLANQGDNYLHASMKTADYEWLLYEYEPWRREEIHLRRKKGGFMESWLSIDRTADRAADGTTGAPDRDACELIHVDIEGDLREPGSGGRVGFANIQPRLATFTARPRIAMREAGLGALHLSLNPWAKVTAVRDADGQELIYLRDHVGRRSSSLDGDLWDNDLTVFLAQPSEQGQELTFEVDYELQVYNYLPGGRGAWYPSESLIDTLPAHTARFDLMFLPKHEVRSMGRRETWEEVDGGRHGVWVIDEPTFMTTFAFAERGAEQSVEVEGLPKITAFGTKGATAKNKMHNIAADVANSANLFQQLFGAPLPQDEIWMVSILGGHGQAFDGFLHLSESTFDSEYPGTAEYFRAHETAHLWWGHLLPWKSYRDQWISEAFASYSALLYVEASMGEKGKKLFAEAIQGYTDTLNGSLEAVTSRFHRFSGNTMNDKHRAQIGPISVGYRAGTADIPEGYQLQAYVKGPLVLHMLRMLLRAKTRNDDVFFATLRDFVKTNAGQAVSTADFQAALTRNAPGNWDWFFDQWIHGTAIPTYEWDWDTAKGDDGKTILQVSVRQSDVPDGFQMPVPVRIDFGGGKGGEIVVPVTKADETFEIPLPRKPKKVELNPGGAVLAKVKKR